MRFTVISSFWPPKNLQQLFNAQGEGAGHSISYFESTGTRLLFIIISIINIIIIIIIINYYYCYLYLNT